MIERLRPPVSEADLHSLAALLVDAVGSGAAVSFLSLTQAEAEDWWRMQLSAASGSIHLVARDPEGIVASVQAHPSWAPNQPHHADVSKLLVHRRARRHGLAKALMAAAEAEARRRGRLLLTLDTQCGSTAERLYHALGYTLLGIIPRYAVAPDGRTVDDCAFFYKTLA